MYSHWRWCYWCCFNSYCYLCRYKTFEWWKKIHIYWKVMPDILYYACTKLRYHLLSNTCIVACHTDIIIYIFCIVPFGVKNWLIGLCSYWIWFGLWTLKVYKRSNCSIFDYGAYNSWQNKIKCWFCYFYSWKLHFYGSVLQSGCSVGVIFILPNGVVFEALLIIQVDDFAWYESKTCRSIMWFFFISGAANIQEMSMFRWNLECLSW